MAAAFGNQNALGGNGGARPDKKTRKKISTFKRLVLDWGIKIMRGKDEELKKQLVLKAISAIIPRELIGEDGTPIKTSSTTFLKVDLSGLSYEELRGLVAKKNTAKSGLRK